MKTTHHSCNKDMLTIDQTMGPSISEHFLITTSVMIKPPFKLNFSTPDAVSAAAQAKRGIQESCGTGRTSTATNVCVTN